MATLEQKKLREQNRIKREAAICADFLKLRKENPDAKNFPLFETLANRYATDGKIAESYPITSMGIRDVLKRNGIYKPRTKTEV